MWILAPEILPIALVGAIVYSTFLIGQRLLNEAAYIRIDHKLNELYHASPLSPEAYFLGMAGGMLLAYSPPILALIVLTQVVYPLNLATWGTLAVVLLAVWAISSSIGYVVSTLFKDMRAIWPYSSLLTNLFGVVPPVFYPLALVPADWQWAALLLPTSSAAILIDSVAGLQPVAADAFALAAGALAVEAVALLAFGIYWARRRAREA